MVAARPKAVDGARVCTLLAPVLDTAHRAYPAPRWAVAAFVGARACRWWVSLKIRHLDLGLKAAPKSVTFDA
jgi:hypothetical protein